MLGFCKSSNLADAYPTIIATNVKPNYQTNNQYKNFPPIMNDGRTIAASYQMEESVNESLLNEHGIKSNWQYRKFMMENADKIRQRMFHDALHDSGYGTQNEITGNTEINIPRIYKSIHETESHTQSVFSDLKSSYLLKEQLKSKMVVPSLTPEQILQLRGDIK